MKASISLFGTCTTDNIFYYASMDGNNPYLLKNRFFQISPISLMLSEPIVPLLDCELTGRFESAIQSIKMDIHKSVFEVLAKKKTDYFVIDVNHFFSGILQIEYEGNIYYLSWLREVRAYNQKVIFETLEKNGATYKILDPVDYIDLIEEGISQFCNKLLTLYEPEKIILVKTYPTNLCIRSDKTLDQISSQGQDEKYVNTAFQLFVDKIQGCHIVDTIKYMLSSYDAIYGIGTFHYDRCYYDYCLECINIITDNLLVDEEHKKLKQLQEIYSQKMSELYESGIYNLIEKNKKTRENNSYALARVKQINALSGTWLERVRNFQGITDQYSPLSGMYQIANFNEYVKFLVENGKGYMLFLAVSDSVGRFWEEFTERKLLGLTADIKERTSYLAVIDLDEKSTVEFYVGNVHELKYDCSIMLQDRNMFVDSGTASMQPLLCYHVSISSKAWEFRQTGGEFLCWARIMVNNVDYAINRRGLNVVVFSKREHCVVDSISIDMHADAALRVRR